MLHVWRAEATEASADAEPGTVVEAKGDRFVVACGSQTALLAEELQLEGRRRMSARDFVNGVRLAPGARLGT